MNFSPTYHLAFDILALVALFVFLGGEGIVVYLIIKKYNNKTLIEATRAEIRVNCTAL
jgi:hypothetical protein